MTDTMIVLTVLWIIGWMVTVGMLVSAHMNTPSLKQNPGMVKAMIVFGVIAWPMLLGMKYDGE